MINPTHDENELESKEPMPPAAAVSLTWLYSHSCLEEADLAGLVQITALELSVIAIKCIERARRNRTNV